jgi:hypothetical protein
MIIGFSRRAPLCAVFHRCWLLFLFYNGHPLLGLISRFSYSPLNPLNPLNQVKTQVKKIELYFFKQSQHFMCFSSCFSDFGTKLDVCSLLHNNKDKHKLFFRTAVGELVELELSFYQSQAK